MNDRDRERAADVGRGVGTGFGGPLPRRGFLERAAAAVAGAALAPLGVGISAGGGTAAAAAGAIEPIPRTRPSHLKLSIAAYSYRQYLTGANPSMTMHDFLEAAADLALDGVEPTSYYFPPNVDLAYLNDYKRRAFRLGLDISGTAIGNNFTLPAGDARDAEIAKAKLWIDRAAEMDAPVIRVFAGSVPRGLTEDEAFANAVSAMEEALAHAERRGVTLALENHGGITTTPDQLLRLVKAIDHPNFGVNLDTGNFRGEDPYADLARLAPYALNVQVKTEIQPAGKPKEPADLERLIAMLRDARYSGYVVLEYEAAEEPKSAIPGHVRTLRRLISG